MPGKTKPMKVVTKSQVKAAATTKSTKKPISSEQRQLMIEEAAYFIGEKQGFPKFSIEAETQIDSQLLQKPR